MTTLEFLRNIPKDGIVKLSDGSHHTIPEFYADAISLNLPSEAIVLKWDILLTRYVNDPDAIYFIRKYGNAPDKQWNLLRRGFLTEYQNCKLIYCDNFLAHYFFNMAVAGFAPDYEDFKNTILNFQFPHGCRDTTEERPYSISPIGKVPQINPNGWKLAHIYSVSQKDYGFDYKTAEVSVFEIGKLSEWQQHGPNRPRKVNRFLSAEELHTVKAHFLRLVHPINYFLVPKSRHHMSDVGNNIGEYAPLLQFMKNIQTEKYGEVYKAFQKRVSALDHPLLINDVPDHIINLKAFKEPRKKATKNKKAGSKAADNGTIADKKIGSLVKLSILDIVKRNILSGEELANLSDPNYSKITFDLNYPFLVLASYNQNAVKVNDHPRYWKQPFNINGEQYYACKEWYEKSRDKFTKWLTAIDNPNAQSAV